jgi:hypothetical protein
MIRQGIRKNLEAHLNEKMKNELFYYEYFSKMENTDLKPNEFIDELVKENLTNNNQQVPFAKIDDGFV